MDCSEIQRLIRKGFIQSDARRLEQARAHLADCAGCTSVYHKLFAAEAALAETICQAEGGEPSTSILCPPEVALLQSRVVPVRARQRWRRVALFLSPALAASLGLLLLYLPRRPAPDRFTARGGATDRGVDAPVGLRALCLLQADGKVLVRSTASDGCAGGRLGLTARNETDEVRYLRVFVLATDRARQVYPAADEVGPLAPGADEQPLGVAIELSDEEIEAARIVGAFSRRPSRGQTLPEAILRGESPDGVQLVELTVRFAGSHPPSPDR
jgi:hypothetical protein